MEQNTVLQFEKMSLLRAFSKTGNCWRETTSWKIHRHGKGLGKNTNKDNTGECCEGNDEQVARN